LTRDQINHYFKKEYKKEHKSGPELALASLPQNDERGTTNGSALVVAPESPLAISLQQNDASPPRKRQKGGHQKGILSKVLKLSTICIKVLVQRLHETFRIHWTSSQKRESAT
jgi:hypothetical protein